VFVLAGGGGCGVVPKTTLDESRRVNQTLRADNARLRDVALDLQSRNQDLSDRAVDDARRLAAQEEALQRLERSVVAYQADRDKIEKAFESIKRQMQLSAESSVSSVSEASAHETPTPTATAGSPPVRLQGFVKAHPGWSFDATSRTLAFLPGLLFEPSSARFKPGATDALEDLARALAASGEGVAFEVRPSTISPVQAAGYDAEKDADASARFVAVSRAARVRDQLLVQKGLKPGQVRLVPPPQEVSPDGDGDRRVTIRIVETDRPETASTPSLDSETQPAR
jgi:hypothetical protein